MGYIDEQHARDGVLLQGGSAYEIATEEAWMGVSGGCVGSDLRLVVHGDCSGAGHDEAGGVHSLPRRPDQMPSHGDDVPSHDDEVPCRTDEMSPVSDGLPGDSYLLSGNADAVSPQADLVPTG